MQSSGLWVDVPRNYPKTGAHWEPVPTYGARVQGLDLVLGPRPEFGHGAGDL